MDSNEGNFDERILNTFGTFEGFNFRTQQAIDGNLTAREVIEWNHDAKGEAEFWPSGDSPGARLLWGGRNVTASELLRLAKLLAETNGDEDEAFMRVHYAVNVQGKGMDELTANTLDDFGIYVFRGSNFYDVRKDAAYELFETFYPELYKIWDESPCDGLHFDTDDFLDSPSWWTEEVKFGDEAVLLVAGL